MLNYIFGFNARMGRLAFFFSSFVIGCGYIVLVFGVTGSTANGRTDVLLAQAANSTPLLIGFYAVLAITFMLQSMRIRDIGWDPVCVMVGWVALVVIDRLVAGRYPEYALTYQNNSTVVGAFVNSALMLVLLFWPGHSDELPADDAGDDASWRRSSTPGVATSRIARVAGGEGRTR